MSNLLIKSGQTVVFAGDSITDCGRRGAERPYGNGYVRQTIDFITAKYPERKINFINVGIGGNNVLDLRNRWHDDVLRHEPDWVTIKIGINDLHRTLGEPGSLPPKRYEELYREILQLTLERTKANVVLIDPFYVSTDTEGGNHRSTVLGMLPGYLKVVAKLAREFGTGHVRTHAAFQRQLKFRDPDRFCPEPVHPYLSGHAVIAFGLLQALDW